MLSKGEFIKLINNYKEFQNYVDKVVELKIDLINSLFHEYPCKLFDWVIRNHFDEDGEDWISYYLYDLPNLEPNKEHVFDKDGNPIPLENLDDLWNLVKDNRK